MSPVYQPPASGSGGVATDVIWDTKGDLAAATGADAAVKVAVGANGTALIADSTQTAGVGWSVPIGTVVDFVEFNADVTISATSEATANTVVTGAGFTPNGTDKYFIQFFSPSIQPASSGQILVTLYDNGSAITGHLGQFLPGTASATAFATMLGIRLTPTNAAHTYSIRAWRGTANGTIHAGGGAYQNGFIRITKDG